MPRLILDLASYELTEEEQELLRHPFVGGVILFSRNYTSSEQVTALCRAIRTINPAILIAVDQEGGRVQRLQTDFVRLPSLEKIGNLYQQSPKQGLDFAYQAGWLMAAELLAVGIDLSFAPVLDLNKNLNTVIGDRALGADPQMVIELGRAICIGMQEAGMATTGKHFPGHGSVCLDSHVALPIDDRELSEIDAEDLQPFIQLIQGNYLSAIMTAHILFPKVDAKPVGFSKKWLQDILRRKLHFTGVIFSDDLNMYGASVVGDYVERTKLALEAGCDKVLMCNNRHAVIEILDYFSQDTASHVTLRGKGMQSLTVLHASSQWKKRYHQFIEYMQ